MLRILFLCLIALSCTTRPPLNPYGVRLVPMEDFFKNREFAQMKISPNGEYLAYLRPYQNRMNIFVRAIKGGEERRLTSQLDRDIAWFFWKEDQTLIFLRDNKGDENFHFYRVNADGTDEKVLTPFPGVLARLISDLDGVSETDLLIELNKRDRRVFDVYRLNVVSGDLSLVMENPGNITSWRTDHYGRLRLGIASDGVNQTVFYRDTEEDEFEAILTTNFRDKVVPLYFTSDNQNIFVLSNRGRDKIALTTFNPSTREEGVVIFKHPDVDLSNVYWSRKRKMIVAVSYMTDRERFHFFDPHLGGHFERISKLFTDLVVNFDSLDRDESKIVVRTYGDKTRGSYFLFDIESGELNHLAEISSWINPDEMASMNPITYQARDGLLIHGHLTLPRGSDGKSLPVVVNPHGGPWARDWWGFNPEVQFLANRGFAVFQMDFRGSTGYGKEFWEKSFKEWGRSMQDDITDGVKFLKEQGIADPDKICIYGGSYGGYATLAGMTFTPDLYACGVSYMGISNLFTVLEAIPPYWEPYREMMYEQIGHPVKDRDLLWAASPLFHIENIKAPLFIAHGAQDPRVKQQESDQIVEALRERGIEVPYLLKEDEGHGFRNEENRFEFYRQMENFLTGILL